MYSYDTLNYNIDIPHEYRSIKSTHNDRIDIPCKNRLRFNKSISFESLETMEDKVRKSRQCLEIWKNSIFNFDAD